MDKELPADLRPLIDAAINMARDRLADGRELPGIAYIDVDVGPEGAATRGLAAIPMQEFPTKDGWARVVRTISSFAQSRFVMMVSEVWVGVAHEAGKLDAAMEKYGSVQNMPGRKECILVQIETLTGFWQGWSELRPMGGASAKAGKTFDDIKLTMPTNNEGRLVGLLGSKPGAKKN